MNDLRIYIGWDKDEQEAYRVLVDSIKKHGDIDYEPLKSNRLRSSGLLTRLVDDRGQKYDLPSNAPCSTDFAVSRFLVPILCQEGWALFMDCDMLFMCDPVDIMKHADPLKAVQVVKHRHVGEGLKMGGMIQTKYTRKNWSSVMLFNCNHPSHQRLSLYDINNRPGRDLHQFYWLDDNEIGELPSEWNWLVGVDDKPANPKIAHFTLGGPWFDDWEPAEHDGLWLNARDG